MELNSADVGRPVRAVLASIGLQLAAATGAAVSFGSLVLLGLSSMDGHEPWIWLWCVAVPFGIAAPALWVSAGAVAARIAGDVRYWATILIGPMAIAAVAVVAT